MTLDYLLFDFSDEEDGRGSFDAMASVSPDRQAALFGEIEAVLHWGLREFGSASADGDWDFALQATCEPDAPLHVHHDPASGRVALSPACDAIVTVSFTLSGSRAFCEAFQLAFDASS